MPPAFLLADPTWSGAEKGTKWVEITSDGVGRPERPSSNSLPEANRHIVADLIQAVENDVQPRVNVYDGRASIEMILACYASQARRGPVELPLTESIPPSARVDEPNTPASRSRPPPRPARRARSTRDFCMFCGWVGTARQVFGLLENKTWWARAHPTKGSHQPVTPARARHRSCTIKIHPRLPGAFESGTNPPAMAPTSRKAHTSR